MNTSEVFSFGSIPIRHDLPIHLQSPSDRKLHRTAARAAIGGSSAAARFAASTPRATGPAASGAATVTAAGSAACAATAATRMLWFERGEWGRRVGGKHEAGLHSVV